MTIAGRPLVPARSTPRLDEFDQEEWWSIARLFNPNLDRDDFDADWREFQQRKAERRRQGIVQ